ncbi:thaumatin-like protein 1 [Fagus crenata]
MSKLHGKAAFGLEPDAPPIAQESSLALLQIVALVSLVDGFNLPVSVATQGGSSECKTSSCAANVNVACLAELQVKGPDGSVLACKSACIAFNQPQYCCTGAFNTPQTCPPTNYSKIFEDQCPQANSYAYDDQNSTFTCSGGPNYVITFYP